MLKLNHNQVQPTPSLLAECIRPVGQRESFPTRRKEMTNSPRQTKPLIIINICPVFLLKRLSQLIHKLSHFFTKRMVQTIFPEHNKITVQAAPANMKLRGAKAIYCEVEATNLTNALSLVFANVKCQPITTLQK